jgi:hypothetical protein
MVCASEAQTRTSADTSGFPNPREMLVANSRQLWMMFRFWSRKTATFFLTVWFRGCWAGSRPGLSCWLVRCKQRTGLSPSFGVSAVTAALNAEFTQLADAYLNLNQSFSTTSFSNCVSSHGGSNVTVVPPGSIPLHGVIPPGTSISVTPCVTP